MIFKKVFFSDSSVTGWGATDEAREIFGFWSESEANYHINYKELLAVKLALEGLGEGLENCNSLLRIDNSTAVAYVNEMGGVRLKR